MFQLIAGPCVIESEEMVLSIAGQMKEITEQLGIPYTFKASFDKGQPDLASQLPRARSGGRTANLKEGQGCLRSSGLHRYS